ncbi:DMT family transporter [Pukyongiella litopenaei]|uniref:EamA family transporter n=1 Tax=Pukyongiella litopenaei TaxID=2605946 RepID=A0A2S0MU45_9RHOB|nr:DMT family transporter [Pukyongiella litopenaei]AVO39317.1 EamA family transporter [Pukyongiella litopenaei]
MSLSIAAIVLVAALLHATWNAVVKGAGDKTVVLGLIALGHVVPGIAVVALAPPPDPVAIPYIIASTVIHWGYYFLLNMAYRLGDLSVMYPVARGLAPVLIAIGAQVWADETLPPLAWAGVLSVSAGIMVLTRGLFSGALPPAAVLAALGTAGFVAAYSLVDGIGIRASGSPLGYIGWLYVAELTVAAFIFVTRWGRVRAMARRTAVLGFGGGVISGAAYALVLYAKTLAPLGIVSALRETSVIFAALIGVLWFGEGPKGNRLLAAVVVAAGIVLIGLANG